MATVQEMISELNDHGFIDTGTTRKIEALQDTIWEIESLKPWPFLETTLDLNFDGSSAIPSNWPTDFRAALRLKDLSTGRRIMPMRLDDFEDRVGNDYAQAGDPRLYYFEAAQLKVWPVPLVSTARLKLRYLQVSDEITDASPESAILIPKRHHRAIVLGALTKLYDMEDDPELASRFEGHFEKRVARMEADLFQLQFDMPDHVHMFDPDDWDYDLL